MTRIASHRGGTLEFGDSTPAGFLATSKMELEEVEFDVHPTRDGQIVVHHDPTLDRTTDRSGTIATMTASEVLAASIQSGQGGNPLLLEELCALYAESHVVFRCEIKPGVDGRPYRDFVPRVVEALTECGRLSTSRFSSFQVESLDAIAQACDRPRLWLVSPAILEKWDIAKVIEIARSHQIPELGIHVDLVTVELMAQVNASGLELGCWAAHSVEQIDKALDLEVKVFTTDRPSLAIERRKLRQPAIAEEVRS
ncbi:glycerophosphodiester phosphodiesterase family protein [Limoniibacter endophyticus]|uniref:Glycerophosphoryl diester phosphodiesterase n=1 Tax=Limoniibacter endophyticus TaxID=1565040 RepID=A0A8J3GIM3_9HYPH|nr:glycerophosphodiester phosphodiesterase family protein [Limoniibacter endophyticus]GHC73029.1 glycerophosphoryl diester phosphodiesterase [Limoniibacter endophyticus]